MGVRGGIGAIAAVGLDLSDPYGDDAISRPVDKQPAEQMRRSGHG
jgi:hypothetical protein